MLVNASDDASYLTGSTIHADGGPARLESRDVRQAPPAAARSTLRRDAHSWAGAIWRGRGSISSRPSRETARFTRAARWNPEIGPQVDLVITWRAGENGAPGAYEIWSGARAGALPAP